MTAADLRIAVLVPCYNEEAAVATVIADFRKALPTATIYVYDNNSKDRTVAVAREAGAEVRSEVHQGKGHAPSAPKMIESCSPGISTWWSGCASTSRLRRTGPAIARGAGC
jgi:glycosyltransferase involved in cell wall biosynthesis